MNAKEFAVCWWAYQKYSTQQILHQTSTEVVTMIKTSQEMISIIPLCSAPSLWWPWKPCHWCYGKQMVPIKDHFLMFGQCRFDVNKVWGNWIGTVWQHELYHVTSQLHCVCQWMATGHIREKMHKLCCLGRPTARPCVVHASSTCVCLWDFHGWRHRAGPHRK